MHAGLLIKLPLAKFSKGKPALVKLSVSKLCLAITLLMLSACASLVSKPIKPEIELVHVRPLNINMSQQKLRFTLKVINPNSFDLPVETINFVARFNDTNIANGKSNQSVTIPANSEAMLSLDVTAGLHRLANTLRAMLQGNDLNLEYELKGTVEVTTWPKPIPFDVIGTMDLTDG